MAEGGGDIAGRFWTETKHARDFDKTKIIVSSSNYFQKKILEFIEKGNINIILTGIVGMSSAISGSQLLGSLTASVG